MNVDNPVDAPTTVSLLIYTYTRNHKFHIGSSTTLARIKSILIKYYSVQNFTLTNKCLENIRYKKSENLK